jgi:ammonia channel protein AmtB
MQVDGAAHGVGAIPRRKRLNELLAIVAVVVIAAIVALLVWAPPLATSRIGAQDANPNAGSAVIHDDAGNVIPEVVGAGSAVVHDDAGNVNR